MVSISVRHTDVLWDATYGRVLIGMLGISMGSRGTGPLTGALLGAKSALRRSMADGRVTRRCWAADGSWGTDAYNQGSESFGTNPMAVPAY